MNMNNRVYEYLKQADWLHVDGADAVEFLAAGEYNENYVATDYAGHKMLFRINRGSQLDVPNQIEYEFGVLNAVFPSGVTPEPFLVDGAAELGNGVMLMQYFPGEQLDYARDSLAAAEVLAKIHTVPITSFARKRMIIQPDPIAGILEESRSLLHRFPDHPMQKEKDRLLAYADDVLELAAEVRDLIEKDEMVIVNTEVNSGNFVVEEMDGVRKVRLVDWEKAVIGSRFADLGHFLVPTTTLWKTDFRFSPEMRLEFLRAYHIAATPGMTFEALDRETAALERAILLRALSWCYMAYYEYSSTERTVKNEETFAKIKLYLDEMECFLA